MFTGSSPTMTSRARGFSQAYQKVGVETGVDAASPHQLVAMLYGGLLDALASARGALQQGQVERKAADLSRAVRIVDEGLKAALNPAGGELTAHLDGLYRYIGLRLTHANLHNDEAAITECVGLIEPLREAWAAIRPQVDTRAPKQ